MVRKILTYMADPSYPALYDKDYANLVNPDGKKQGDDPAEKKGTGRGKKRKKGAGGKGKKPKKKKGDDDEDEEEEEPEEEDEESGESL